MGFSIGLYDATSETAWKKIQRKAVHRGISPQARVFAGFGPQCDTTHNNSGQNNKKASWRQARWRKQEQ